MHALATARLDLEPLVAAHAAAMFTVLDDPALYAYIDDDPPASVDALRAVYERRERRRSPDGRQHWLNWIVRPRGAAPIGYVQATVDDDASAWVAYVIARPAWGRGYAREATEAMLEHLIAHYGATRFLAVAEAGNARSIGLLQRLGFRAAEAGDAGDAVGYGLTPSERAFVRSARL